MNRKRFSFLVSLLLAALVTILAGRWVAPSLASTASPPTAIVQAQVPEPPPEPAESSPAAALSGNYTDPGGQFQVGLVQGYAVAPTAGVFLVESPDRALAYTVVTRLRATDQALSPNALGQVTIEAFERGNGFVPSAIDPVDPATIRLPFQGQAADGPLSGEILTRQVGTTLIMLMVAATEPAADRVEPVVAALLPTLGLPEAVPEAAAE